MDRSDSSNSVKKKVVRQPFDGEKKLYELVRVRLVHSGRVYEVTVSNHRLMPGMKVLVKIRRNVLLAEVMGHRYRQVAPVNSLPYVIRIATDEDIAIDAESYQTEKTALQLATDFAFEHKLAMKVLGADLSVDRKNITINFASDVRVDFRKMVSYLAQNLNLRVEMYQLGLRNGTGLLCGMGSCGQQLCCGRFLDQFDPVAVKLLRAQGLVTNPKRISGVCGRLFCCLSYEYSEKLQKRSLPKKGTPALTRWGLGKVTELDIVREEIIVLFENGDTQRVTPDDVILEPDPECIPENFPLERAKFYLNQDPSSAISVRQEAVVVNEKSIPHSRMTPRVRRNSNSRLTPAVSPENIQEDKQADNEPAKRTDAVLDNQSAAVRGEKAKPQTGKLTRKIKAHDIKVPHVSASGSNALNEENASAEGSAAPQEHPGKSKHRHRERPQVQQKTVETENRSEESESTKSHSPKNPKNKNTIRKTEKKGKERIVPNAGKRKVLSETGNVEQTASPDETGGRNAAVSSSGKDTSLPKPSRNGTRKKDAERSVERKANKLPVATDSVEVLTNKVAKNPIKEENSSDSKMPAAAINHDVRASEPAEQQKGVNNMRPKIAPSKDVNSNKSIHTSEKPAAEEKVKKNEAALTDGTSRLASLHRLLPGASATSTPSKSIHSLGVLPGVKKIEKK